MLYLETEVRGEASALVIAPDKVYVVGMGNLQRQEVQQHFARKLSAVNIIPQEEIAGETEASQGHKHKTHTGNTAIATARGVRISARHHNRMLQDAASVKSYLGT